MQDSTHDNGHKPPQTAPLETKPAFDGSRTVAEIAETLPGVAGVALGKQSIKDAGRRMAQIRGLKPGSSSIRSTFMIEEILTRLTDGETITSITCDPHMPAPRTLWGWCDRDEKLAADIASAQARGQRVLADLRLNIAAGGEFSTGDARRDEILIKAINSNLAQRNRAEFGDRIAVDQTVSVAPVMLPIIPRLEDFDND